LAFIAPTPNRRWVTRLQSCCTKV